MDEIKGILESLRASAYNLAALLLPGALLLEIVQRAFALGALIPWSQPVPYAVAAYATGFVLQGVSCRLFARPVLRKAVALADLTRERDEAVAAARALVLRRYEVEDVPAASVVDIALTRAADKREVYDKFVAMRDMARALTVVFTVMFIAAAVRLAGAWHAKDPRLVRECAVAVAAAALGLYGAFDRLQRFQVAAEKAIVGVFIASELQLRPGPKGGPDSGGGA
jgi:hypothetical protein